MEQRRDTPIEATVRGLPQFSHPLAEQVTRALEGAVYPLTRAELLVIARENEASKTLLSIISSLPNRRFGSEAEVTEVVEERPLTTG